MPILFVLDSPQIRILDEDLDGIEVESDAEDDSEEILLDDEKIFAKRISSAAEFMIKTSKKPNDGVKKAKKKRIRLKPEQLGLTNLRKPGRPKNPPTTTSDSSECCSSSIIPTNFNENNVEKAKDIENLFGFAATVIDDAAVDLDDSSVSVETILAPNEDASLQPLVINDATVSFVETTATTNDNLFPTTQLTLKNPKLEPSSANAATIIFDLTTEERLEIVQLANTTLNNNNNNDNSNL